MFKAFLVLIAFLLTVETNFAQEIEANVNVNTEQLSPENRVNVTSMASDVERYINSQNFSGTEWEGPKIPVEINIVLSGGGSNVYGARMFVASKRYIYGQEGGTSVALKMVENKWSFEYQRGAMFTFNLNRYDKFSSMIDFYMLMVLGYDLDSFEPLGGTDMFERAQKIARLGSGQNIPGFETFSNPGEFTKYALVRELTDPRYEPFRKLIYEYYYDGLDMMAEDKKLAMETLDFIIQEMATFKEEKLTGPSLMLQVFFESKYDELASLFVDYENKSRVYNNLIYMDPTPTKYYNEAMEK